MKPGFDPSAYGESAAPVYDQLYPTIESGLLSTLLDLAGDGPVLDLGSGTGRVAIPLARAGVAVYGVEASASMIAAFRTRAGHEQVGLIEGDFTRADLGCSFQLIFSLVSTFYLLPTLDLQRACLRNIASHLHPGGLFVCEAHTNERAFPLPDTTEIPIIATAGKRRYRATTLSTPLHALDSMARDAGLDLSERWGTWARVPYSAANPRHISVYRRALRDAS